MEKQGSGGAAGSLTPESPRGAARGVPGSITGVEAGSGLPSAVVLAPGSGVAAVRGSRTNQPPGEVVGHSLVPGTYPAAGTSDFGSKGPGVHTSGFSTRSGSTSLHPHKPHKDRPRSILKTSNPTLRQEPPRAEREKSQHWDEMNIMATYHPADKDYGFMTVDEPPTPYHRLDSDEPSQSVTPEALTERFATMDNFDPKVLQHPGDRSSGSSDNFSKTYSSGFEKHRKTHYSEGKFLKAQKNQPLGNDEKSNGGSERLGPGGRSVMLGPESRPVERGWAGGLARGVRDETGPVSRPVERGRAGGLDRGVREEICLVTRPVERGRAGGLARGVRDETGPESRPVERGRAGGLARAVRDEICLVTRNHIREAEDSCTFRNQSPASAIIMPDKGADLQRKEYYSKGRYLRSCPYPELEEDMEDEQQDTDCSTSLSWASENSIGTEVCSLDHRGSPLRDHRPSGTP